MVCSVLFACKPGNTVQWNPWNEDTSLIRTHFIGPRVSVLKMYNRLHTDITGNVLQELDNLLYLHVPHLRFLPPFTPPPTHTHTHPHRITSRQCGCSKGCLSGPLSTDRLTPTLSASSISSPKRSPENTDQPNSCNTLLCFNVYIGTFVMYT